MNVFTIKDLENLSGIKAHTIRIWEQRYTVLKPCRTETNIRYYCNQELKTVLNISLLNKYGYRISHIDKMSGEEIHARIGQLKTEDAQQERLVNELITHMIDLDIAALEKSLDVFILAHGINQAIDRIIFPFLHRIGVLWLTHHIHPAQEHLVFNVIRQKLIVGIDSMPPLREAVKTVLLFLPEGVHHELGLLYVHYLLRSHDVNVLYMGADMPLKDLEFVSKYKAPDLLYTHLTGGFPVEKFLSQVSHRLPDIPLVVSGQLTAALQRKMPEKVHFRRTLPEVLDFIAQL